MLSVWIWNRMRRCVYLGRKWCAVIEPGMRSCTHGYNCYTNISVHWFIRIMLLNPALYTSDLMLCVSVCWGLLQSDWGFWCMERANKAARKCHYVCVFNVYYSRMSCGRKSMQWEHSSYQFLISLSLRKHTVTHNEKNTDGNKMSHHVWLYFGDSVLKSSGTIWIQEGYFTGAVHSERQNER